jgi:hypothetical protein
MQSLKERYITATEAFTRKKVLWFGGIWAAATFILHWMTQISSGNGLMLLNTPPLAWAAMVFLVGLVYFLFEYAHRQRELLIPQFDVSFDQHNLGIVQTPTEIYTVDSGGVYQKMKDSYGAYARIRIDALSKVTIDDCVVFLTAIHKKGNKSNQFERVELLSPIPLTPQPISVYSIVPRFVDFFQVGEDNIPAIPPPQPLTLLNLFKEPAAYLFTMVVVAGNLSKDIQIELNWPGEWNKLSGNQRSPIFH